MEGWCLFHVTRRGLLAVDVFGSGRERAFVVANLPETS